MASRLVLAVLALAVHSASSQVWEIDEWGSCSQTCGGGGLRSRRIRCLDEQTREILPWVDCTDAGKAQPSNLELCGIVDCPKKVRYLPGPCSASCGGGTVEWIRVCTQKTRNGQEVQLPPEDCAHIQEDRPGRRECNNDIPCRPHYQIGPWGRCSVTCGRGTRERRIVCRQRRGGRTLSVERKICETAIGYRVDTSECNTRVTCPGNYLWTVGEWTSCSVRCSRTRTVRCYSKEDKKHVDKEKCKGLPKPLEEEQCIVTGGQYVWKTTQWGECSRTCGGGTQTREIRCVDNNTGKPAVSCPICLKPRTEQRCNALPCITEGGATTCTDIAYCDLVKNNGYLCSVAKWEEDCCLTCRAIKLKSSSSSR